MCKDTFIALQTPAHNNNNNNKRATRATTTTMARQVNRQKATKATISIVWPALDKHTQQTYREKRKGKRDTDRVRDKNPKKLFHFFRSCCCCFLWFVARTTCHHSSQRIDLPSVQCSLALSIVFAVPQKPIHWTHSFLYTSLAQRTCNKFCT